MKAEQLVHRLLFHALTEMRAEGHESGNKMVYHLADLFHNPALLMEKAAQGDQDCTYDDVLKFLTERARDKGLERWLEQRIAEVEARHESGVAP